ncbi:hypothetical protein DPMN_143583 [Dreissena polymorpha]|uniref:Uncharacterized protein n=1 Tax=Dreissena polymorpha TaxID=45954 RepID=A0A9D4GDB4_DREPO|nr:hypothetical protein DPMN_143583 [Dreissena polymorpha]
MLEQAKEQENETFSPVLKMIPAHLQATVNRHAPVRRLSQRQHMISAAKPQAFQKSSLENITEKLKNETCALHVL